MFFKSRASSWSRLLVYRNHLRNLTVVSPNGVFFTPSSASVFSRNFSVLPHFPGNLTPWNASLRSRFSASAGMSPTEAARLVYDILAEADKDRERERENWRIQGLDIKDIDEEDEEDYIGVGPLIEKLEKHKLNDTGELNSREESSDPDGKCDEVDWDEERKKGDIFKKKFQRHKDLLQSLADCANLDEAVKWMNKIDKFEEKHFKIQPDYRIIGELTNNLKMAEGKEKFILQQKLNRAMKLVEWKEAFDPNNPANFGISENAVPGAGDESAEKEREKLIRAVKTMDDNHDEAIDEMKERDDILLEKLNEIDKKLERRLADLEHTFGKKKKLLEEEILNPAEESNTLTEKKRLHFSRKGFDVRTIDVNRVCRVTKGGRKERYTALLVCGNYDGVIGYAKAKADTAQAAIQKAYEKCFQNLYYLERHDEQTVAHAIQTSYKKTKLYLWPAPTRTGMKGGRIVKTILNLAGFKNIKSKVIGSRNPQNTVETVLKALNAIETPKDG